MADDFERRFRTQAADIFQPGAVPRIWTDLGLAYLRFSDENSNPRSLDQQLLNVLNRARRDGVFVPWQYVLADAAVSGTLACRRGYKSARITDEAVLGTVMAAFFTDGFIADLTADVNTRLAELARRPIRSTKKLEQEIANEDRQLKRLTDRLAKLDDTHLDAVLAKAEEMGRQLAAKREQLKELQRASRRPKVKSVKEKDVVAELTQMRDLLQGDVGIAAQVLKALVGDVILETRQVEGKAKPQMVARFTINAVPALAVLDRGTPMNGDDSHVSLWGSIRAERPGTPPGSLNQRETVVPLPRTLPRKQ